MPLSKEHKAKTRTKILDAAGVLFREHGFDGIGIDDIMKKAGLTRGGFYAHFASKADLFANVLKTEPAFTRMLKERQPSSQADALTAKAAAQNAALDVLATYLDPDNIAYVTSTCPMVSLARDVDKGGAPAREAFTHVTSDLISLLKSGMSGSSADQASADQVHRRALAVLALCVGGVTVARTAADPVLAQTMLQACEEQARRLMTL